MLPDDGPGVATAGLGAGAGGRATAGRRLAVPAGVAALLAAATGYVATVDPGVPGHYPGCPFLLLTGWYCPGCGSLRAVHALSHGHLGTALHDNAVTTLAVPLALWAWIAWTRRSLTGRALRWMAPPWVMWTLLGGLLVFSVLRNLPAFGWLAP